MIKKILKIIGITLVSFVVLIGIVSLFLSPKSHIERSVVINAPDSVIFLQVNSLKNQNKWSPWVEHDPNTQVTYEGSETGVGAKMNWKSEKLGNGSQWIVESVPNKHLKSEMQFEGFGGTNTSDINLEPTDGGTKVTWTYDGDVTGSGFIMVSLGKIMNLMMDSMMGGDYERGMSKLKTLAESNQQK
ncbi:MAG: SRPBCC family protein [Bacteroidetes bacterium]|nr:SRPBCC family protein [Bacteroidota bacterium]